MYLSILLPFAIPFYNRSHLPAGTSGTAAAFDTSLLTPEVSGAGDESRPPPLYLPTAENRDAYKIIVVERKVVVPPPAEPVKDARTIELEVYVVELRGTNRRPYMWKHKSIALVALFPSQFQFFNVKKRSWSLGTRVVLAFLSKMHLHSGPIIKLYYSQNDWC